MNIPLVPSQVAAELGVATVTVYKWIESKRLPATSVQAGLKTRIFVSREAVEVMRAEMAEKSLKATDGLPPAAPDAMEWARRYIDLIGKTPPLYGAFRHGKVTFEQMKTEAIRRFDCLR